MCHIIYRLRHRQRKLWKTESNYLRAHPHYWPLLLRKRLSRLCPRQRNNARCFQGSRGYVRMQQLWRPRLQIAVGRMFWYIYANIFYQRRQCKMYSLWAQEEFSRRGCKYSCTLAIALPIPLLAPVTIDLCVWLFRSLLTYWTALIQLTLWDCIVSGIM